MRAVNGGQARTPGDIPCAARLIQPWQFHSNYLRRLTADGTTMGADMYQILLQISHLQFDEIPRCTVQQQDRLNTDVNVR